MSWRRISHDVTPIEARCGVWYNGTCLVTGRIAMTSDTDYEQIIQASTRF